jgi:uncharacterized repeat protein (TIGR03803 family)
MCRIITSSGRIVGKPETIGCVFEDASGSGSASNYGTVFKLSEDGRETVLHSFAGGSSDGRNPYAGLVRDAAGNLYGTTELYPTFDFGTVFKVDTSGKETVLHAFTGPPDGAYPIGGLIRDKNGNLYGTTNSGGDMYCNYPYGCGTAEPCSRWIRAASRPYCTALLGRLMAHSRSHDGKSAVAA